MSESDPAMSFRLPLAVTVPAILIALAPYGWSQQPPVPPGRRPNNPNTAPTGPPPKPGTVEGSVTNALSHAPIRQATVSISGSQGYSYVAQTDDGGKFHIPNVSPDTYYVGEARAQSFRYRQPTRFASGLITVAEAQDVTGIKVEMDPLGVISGKVVGTDGGQVSGTVQTDSGDPGLNARVIIVPADRFANRRDLLKFTGVDPTGHFQSSGLAPGEYKVYACEDSDLSLWYAGDFRNELSNRATPITVAAGGSATAQVKTIPDDDLVKAKAKLR